MAPRSLFAARLLVAAALLVVGGQAQQQLEDGEHHVQSNKARATEAYATLVYGEDFVLGARVLGQSLRETGTTKDMVALTTGSLSAASELTLASDGWRVIHVAPVANPGKGPQAGRGFPAKFKYVYTKLYIFRLTEYSKVVFIDADTLVLRNMDSIFRCPGFCAALRHSERFNTGVMVLEPSLETYNDIMKHIQEMPSYTGGDQGFLNSYFSGFAHGPLFDPTANYAADQYKYMRLPTTFNADIGLYVVGSNRWMIPRDSIFVFHYTLGPFKPWVWWTSWLVREMPAWDSVRARLPRDSRGLAAGSSPQQLFAERWMVLIPWFALALVIYFYVPAAILRPAALGSYTYAALRNCFCGAGLPLSSTMSGAGGRHGKPGGSGGKGGGGGGGELGARDSSHGHGMGAEVLLRMQAVGADVGGGNADCFPRMFVAGSIAAGYGCVLVATVITILIVPNEVSHAYGWLLSFEWGFLLLFASYGLFLSRCYMWGRLAGPHASLQHMIRAVSHKPWGETLGSAVVFMASLLLAPWMGRLLGIQSFIGNIIATVFVGLGVILITTTQFLFLPAQWYVAGRLASGRGD